MQAFSLKVKAVSEETLKTASPTCAGNGEVTAIFAFSCSRLDRTIIDKNLPDREAFARHVTFWLNPDTVADMQPVTTLEMYPVPPDRFYFPEEAAGCPSQAWCGNIDRCM